MAPTIQTLFNNPENYTNRELSWVKFDERVLDEASDASNPLMERVKFLSITASNLDEFFMVRVASLKDMEDAGYKKADLAGLTPKQQLSMLDEATHELVKKQYYTLNEMLMPALKDNGLHILTRFNELTEAEGEYVDKFFEDSVYPVLTPMAVDSSRPFPLISNKSLNIAAILHPVHSGLGNKDKVFATVQVPSGLPRIIELPLSENAERRIIFLEEVIRRNIQKLFLNYSVICTAPYRIMRNADFSLDEEEAADLLQEIEKQLKARQRGHAIRLEIEEGADKKILDRLKKELDLSSDAIYTVNGPIDLTVFMKVYGLDGFDELKEHSYAKPQPVPEFEDQEDIFEVIRKGDVLMHHPYQSFAPVVKFIEQAAIDKDVLAIKQTLYRVSGNSPIIKALAKAAENGKQVTVLVELKARFDEENNIVWARMLERAGCHVIYGLVGLKTHSKITLVVRKEEDGIRRYVHLSTGNYNDSTAKLYTDLGMFTCSETIGEDATAVFNMLSGYSEPRSWNKLSLAPLWLKDRFMYLIAREALHAKEGREARIIAKMNSLCDADIISALYEASAAGVKIDLIVRGICCLKVGIPGISENITVRSIVGNYLEHARVFFFENDGQSEYYLASADWMPRNLERRVEILFPVERPELRDKLHHILDCQLKDNVKAQILDSNGDYKRVQADSDEKYCAQLGFSKEAVAATKEKKNVTESRVFIPKMGNKE